MSRPGRTSLTVRVAAVIIAVVVLAGTIAALLGLGLVRGSAERQAQHALARQADVAAGLIDRAARAGTGTAVTNRVTGAVLRALDVPAARVSPAGAVTGDPVAVAVVHGSEVATLLAGRTVSSRAAVSGRTLLVEGRPLSGGGGIVLARPVTEAVGAAAALLSRQLIALLIGVAVAAVAGLLLARSLASPLRRLAAATLRLARGGRDVRVDPRGPAEVAQVAEAVNTLADALATSEGREREFLLSVTHELRTPLTAVKGFAEAVADGVATGEAARRAGAVILAESARLEHLIGDLLDLARLGADDFSIVPVPVDLTAVMADAATVWLERCSAVGVRFAADLPPGPLVVATDARRIRQIVDGLLENALRVTPVDREIRLTLAPDPAGGAVFQVADGGPGLTADDRAVAFQRSALYTRYRGVRPVGTGLGLALVHALATRLGGAASVAEAPGGGALFAIRIPASAAALAGSDHDRPGPAAAAARS
jgi:two-component system sensor histidine kinase BaeS